LGDSLLSDAWLNRGQRNIISLKKEVGKKQGKTRKSEKLKTRNGVTNKERKGKDDK
jgi:hypothetical protein